MEILPYDGTDDLRFGQSRGSIREKLGDHYRQFHKGRDTDVDAYDELGLHLYYDDCDQLEFIEAFFPASLSLQGVQFVGRHMNDIEFDLRLLGYDTVHRDAGLQSDGAGIAVFAPGGIVEAISVFPRGYYGD